MTKIIMWFLISYLSIVFADQSKCYLNPYNPKLHQNYLTINATLNCTESGWDHLCNWTFGANNSCAQGIEWIGYPSTYCSPYCCVGFNGAEILIRCHCPNQSKPTIILNETLIVQMGGCYNPTNPPDPGPSNIGTLFILLAVSAVILVLVIIATSVESCECWAHRKSRTANHVPVKYDTFHDDL